MALIGVESSASAFFAIHAVISVCDACTVYRNCDICRDADISAINVLRCS